MPVFSGNTAGSILQVAKNIPSGVLSFRITNMTAGDITVNIYVVDSGTSVSVINKDYIMNAGDMRLEDKFIKLLAGSSIFIITSGSLDYYFSID